MGTKILKTGKVDILIAYRGKLDPKQPYDIQFLLKKGIKSRIREIVSICTRINTV